MSKRIRVAVLMFVCFIVWVGFGKDSGAGTRENPYKSGDRVELIMASGGVGGTYYPLAGGMAKLWKDKIPGLNVTVQATGASVANIRLLGKNDVDLALVQNDIAEYGRTGVAPFAEKKEKYANYLAIGALYPEPLQIVVSADSPIKSIEDLKGKTVVVGAAGSGTELASRQVFESYGLDGTNNKDLKPLFLGFAEGATALREKSADALIIVSGIPNASIADVQTFSPVRLLPIDVNRLNEKYPFYVEYAVPAGTYKGMDREVKAVALKAMLVTRDVINSQLVYELTKNLFENASAIGHAKAREFNPKLAIQGVTIPFHPGAARYFKGIGIDVATP